MRQTFNLILKDSRLRGDLETQTYRKGREEKVNSQDRKGKFPGLLHWKRRCHLFEIMNDR